MANASINDTTTSQKPASKNATKMTSEKPVADNGKWISKESYDEMVERGTELLSRGTTSATGIVRDYPLQAAVGGLVVGFLLGSLFSRRSSAV